MPWVSGITRGMLLGMLTIGDLTKAKKLAKRIEFQGLQISIETRKGAYRYWHDPHSGRDGKTKMLYDYGYVRGSVGADGEHVDCYVGPDRTAAFAYVVNQQKAPSFTEFDEQKVMLGFSSADEAKRAYLGNFDDPRFFGSLRVVPMIDFKSQVLSTSTHQPLVLSEKPASRSNEGERPMDTHSRRFTVHFPRLTVLSTLLKAANPPAGFSAVPRSTKGGYRKRTADGWVYWYPSAEEHGLPTEWNETMFAHGAFDKTPAHWHFIRGAGGNILPWTAGGVDPLSKHPVKIAGRDSLLYQIIDAEHERGWSKVRNVNSGEESVIQHDRIYPVEYSRLVPKKPVAPQPPRTGTPPRDAPGSTHVGWHGDAERIPAYTGSTAKPGSMLHRVESGRYPRKSRTLWREDADGTPRKVTDTVMAMPDADKVGLLAEMQPLIRKMAEITRRRMGVAKTDTTTEDMRAAAMEGVLHAIDNYRGGYSFGLSAKAYVEQYTRLHAVREFAGGYGLSKREARMMPGFIAARAEANRRASVQGRGEADAKAIAAQWKLRKRDRHAGLEQGADDPIPMGSYSLRDGAMVGGKDKPGKVALARAYLAFVDGQANAQSLDFGEDDPVIPGAGVGYGFGASERLELQHSLHAALTQVQKFHVVVDRKIYQVDAADLLRRRLGLEHGAEPEGAAGVAEAVPFFRIASDGTLKQLSPRAARELVDTAVSQALDHVKGALEGQAASLVDQARKRLTPPPEVSAGPTMRDRIAYTARTITREDVTAWRAQERQRLGVLASRYSTGGDRPMAQAAQRARDRLSTIGLRQARKIIAEQRLVNLPRNAAWFRSALAQPVEVTDPRNEYGHTTMTMTDLATGQQRTVRVRTLRDVSGEEDAYKSETSLSSIGVVESGVLRMVQKFPRLSHVLWGSDDAMAFAPTIERAQVLEAMGM